MPSAKRLLTDAIFIRPTLHEDADRPGKFIVRGEFGHAGRPTQNKRLYGPSAWTPNILRMEDAMRDRKVHGELDHPDDGKTKLARTSHFVTNLKLQEDGVLIGEAEILDTPAGKTLKAIIQAGGMCGVSSRGWGSTTPTDKGYEIVEDYNLVTFDFVADPADSSAYPSPVFEGLVLQTSSPALRETVDKKVQSMDPILFEARLQQEKEKIKAELAERFAAELKTQLGVLRKQMAEEYRSEVDPAKFSSDVVSGINKAMQASTPLDEATKAVVSAKNEEIDQLKGLIFAKDALLRESTDEKSLLEGELKTANTENVKLGRLAIVTGLRFYAEQQLAGDPDASTVRSLVGDISSYPTIASLQGKLKEIREGLEDQRRIRAGIESRFTKQLTEMQEAHAAERRRSTAELQRTQAQTQKLEDLVKQALEGQKALLGENKKLQMQLHAESRLASMPQKSSNARMVLAKANPATPEDMDEILEELKPQVPRHDLAEQTALRNRLRATFSGRGSSPEGEEAVVPNPRLQMTSQRGLEEDVNGTGLSTDEFARLSGLR